MALSTNNIKRHYKRKHDNSSESPNLFDQLRRKVEESKRSILNFNTTEDDSELDSKSKLTSLEQTWSSIHQLVNAQYEIIEKLQNALATLRDSEHEKDSDHSADSERMTIDDLADYFLVCIKIESCRRLYNPHYTFKNKSKKQKTIDIDTNGNFQKMNVIEYQCMRILNNECKKRRGKEEVAAVLSVNLIYDRFYKNNPQNNQPCFEAEDIVRMWDKIRQFSTSGLDEKRAMKQDLEKGAKGLHDKAQYIIDSIQVDHLMSLLPPEELVSIQSDDSHLKVPDRCVVCGAQADGDKVYCRDYCLVKDLDATFSTCEENVS